MDVWCAAVGFAFMSDSIFAKYQAFIPTEIFALGELPWRHVDEGEIMHRLQNREKLAKSSHCPAALYALMLDCWKLDVQRRIQAPIIVEVA